MAQAESSALVNNLDRKCARTSSITDLPPTGLFMRAHDQFKENMERGTQVRRSNVAVKMYELQLVHNRGVPCQRRSFAVHPFFLKQSTCLQDLNL
jgi:hypothetical protein